MPGRATDELTKDFFAIPNLEDEDDQFFVLNRVDGSIVTLAVAIEVILAGEFVHGWRTGIVLQVSWPGFCGHQVKTHRAVVRTPTGLDNQGSDGVVDGCRTLQ